MQDPELRLRELDIRPRSYFDAGRAARLDPTHRVRINHEVYFFADAVEVKRFLADPPRFAGPLTDPVSGLRFVPARTAPRAEHAGVLYYFLSEENRAAFVAAPDTFATPKFHMMLPDTTAM